MSNTRLNRNKKISFIGGNHISRLPFGYKRLQSGKIVFNKEEIEVVKKIFILRKEENGYYKIAKQLKLFDYMKNPRKIFVKNIIENPFYAGYIRFNDKIVEGNQESIINVEEFCSINNKNNIEEFIKIKNGM